jgi:hypothetical protein
MVIFVTQLVLGMHRLMTRHCAKIPDAVLALTVFIFAIVFGRHYLISYNLVS